MIMRILVLSDLHLEFGSRQPSSVCFDCGRKIGKGVDEHHGFGVWFGKCQVCGKEDVSCAAARDFGGFPADWALGLPDPRAYDLVVLAGDIHLGTQGIEWAGRTFACPVIYVAGNHEFYNENLRSMIIDLHDAASAYRHIHLLDNVSVVIDGVRFIGSTLWTDFQLFGIDQAVIEKCMRESLKYVTDFSTIRYELKGYLSPEDTVDFFGKACAFLRESLAMPFDGKTVVVTHHLPSNQSVASRFANDPVSAAFASNLDDLVKRADVWIHGHTHDSFDYRIGRCRVVCNPRGYPDRMREQYENEAFDSHKIIQVAD